MWIIKIKLSFSRFSLESTDLIPDQLRRSEINQPVLYKPTVVFHSQFFGHSEGLRAGLMWSLLDLLQLTDLRPATEDKHKFYQNPAETNPLILDVFLKEQFTHKVKLRHYN